MFRRLWSSLPKDASFPSDLKGLGYFVNDQDEIRSIKDPDYYFKFFLDKNERRNIRQRFEFNRALEDIVHQRLENEGLERIALPLGTPTSQPHVPIFASHDLMSKSRVVVIFGETTQDLGILAGRVANGAGGINKGSMVSVVQALKTQRSSETDSSPPGIVLANVGQLYWWPEGKRALTVTGSVAIPMPSLVHVGKKHNPELNCIPGNEDFAKHVFHMFDSFLPQVVGKDAKLDIIAIGESCELVERVFDVAGTWMKWCQRLNSMVLLDTVYSVEDLVNSLLKDFLAKRARGYIRSSEAIDTPLSSPAGNSNECIPPVGCPCYSSSESQYSEMIFIRALPAIMSYMQKVALTPDYENETIVIVEKPDRDFTEEDWNDLPEEEKPVISTADPEAVNKGLKQHRRWEKFEKTGVAPDSDSEHDSDVEDGDGVVVVDE